MKRMIINLFSDESGAAAVEYGLIASLISIAAMVALTAYGASLSDLFNRVHDAIDGAIAAGK
jgi:pilus assembly protein Flp/PilA